MDEPVQKLQRKGRGSHPNSKKNLKLFEKGKSGNPNGNPIGTTHFRTRFANKLHAIAPDGAQAAKSISEFCKSIPAGKITNADALDAILLYKAIIKQDLAAIKEILDRTEGKAMQSHEHSGKDGNPIEQIFKIQLTDD